ncbi:glutamate synthase [Hyphomicrobium nitrativorans NL23]|uniref:Glutamate synthase [NADPH] large chain n=1 Tax=Hyphomicrobium nitrativorans NL23 TaxID=1029756 RepID=V5SF22_9HYPH|nr:glutamate synthase large subunit [Hyphomicrobium nitrativorans]AHB49466.1 glutamate synthase [Hyphomicrobium nitrativorans NL23]
MTRATPSPGLTERPQAEGLFDPAMERDACGVGFIANLKGAKSHRVIADALAMLCNLEHRGAVGADPLAGDGAGMLIQIPHAFFKDECAKLGFSLPEALQYAVGQIFMPRDARLVAHCQVAWERICGEQGLNVLGWRDVPVDNSCLSDLVKATEPVHRQVFIARPIGLSENEFERRLYLTRKVVSNALHNSYRGRDIGHYPVSLSSRTVVYKGMFLSYQVGAYYTDLSDPRVVSAMALVHQRFSTNTFPSWKLSHPYRMVAHNGEINTLRGNVNWMAARQASVSSPLYGDDIAKLWPISYEGQSDTACFDNALEFLVMGGYSLAHAAMVLIPEAWAGNPMMDGNRRAFYEYHAALMEPWDGPAAMAFTDGRQIGATLDRNGLRPARYIVTDDDMVIMASEAGVIVVPEEKIVRKWRLQPGKMLLIDLEKGAIVSDEELKAELASNHPYEAWVKQNQILVSDLPLAKGTAAPKSRNVALLDLQQTFGYTQESLKFLMTPMGATGQEAIGSMGNDSPISAMSSKSKLLHTYFKQNFAQVTNPPIDSIREELVMSLVSFIGPRPNILDLEGTSKTKRLEVAQPILTNEDLERIRQIGEVRDNHFASITIDITYSVDGGPDGMGPAVDVICAEAEEAVRSNRYNIIILSDRLTGPDRVPIPSLLATSAVHHHLIRQGLRTSVGLVVETGEAHEVHQFCTLAGYGAEAINPYLAFDTLAGMAPSLGSDLKADDVTKKYIKAVGKALLKVMAKMGISTYQSYCGAQIFDAVGLRTTFVRKYFTGTHTQIEGVGLREIARETFDRHAAAFGNAPVLANALDVGGDYAFRVRGEAHVWRPNVVADLQHAVRSTDPADAQAGRIPEKYRAFAKAIDAQSEQLLTIRGLFRIRSADSMGRAPVPIDEVEPASAIVKRFATGAMSFGSISREAHTTLAIAMNRIGGKSNTGEGGEEVDRFKPMANGDTMRSAIKQIASGRFGVTTEYLVNSDMMQIKMAQGAKPGEGGQLPGHKVDATIAKVRHSTPGVGLISPPPHHDIYSIEDLAQLIFDLKNTNPEGQVSVKLVSEVGVGTVAAGVAKARADHVTISGYEGGTGASPLTSLKHAGAPWEMGLAETHQTLVGNRLRGRIAVQVDGGLRTGRDVIIGALLGADEFGFSTAPLIAAGCIMMRKCHLNTCPVGVATQDPVLRARFTGQPEHVINYFFFIAEEVREYMAAMGYRSFQDMVGQSDWLDKERAISHWKARGLDFSKMFHKPRPPKGVAIHHCETQDHGLEKVLDNALIEVAKPALDAKKPVKAEFGIKNTDRTAGTMLSGRIAKLYGHAGLPEDTIWLTFKGTAGQSFGAWAAHGLTLDLVGEGNDYVGKGLSGAKIIVRPDPKSGIVPEESIIVGNTVMYGAITGECYFRGVAGERFAVRNSGAYAVVEGTGDHGCEYMTGGVVVVLGPTGRNFAAGMSGGVAYVLDEAGDFDTRLNKEMVQLEAIAEDAALIAELAKGNGASASRALADVMGDMREQDLERLHALIVRHAHYTNSVKAQAILADWAAYVPKFRKVMPTEYARALAELAKARTAANDVQAQI